MRLSAHNLNPTRIALKHRAKILSRSLSENNDDLDVTEENIWGEGVEVVHKCKPNRKPITPAEKKEFVARYEAGASMGEIARFYNCHHTTVGKILRQMGVEIRLRSNS